MLSFNKECGNVKGFYISEAPLGLDPVMSISYNGSITKFNLDIMRFICLNWDWNVTEYDSVHITLVWARGLEMIAPVS